MPFLPITHGNIVFPPGGISGVPSFSPRQSALYMPLSGTLVDRPAVTIRGCVRASFDLVGDVDHPELLGCEKASIECPAGIQQPLLAGAFSNPFLTGKK